MKAAAVKITIVRRGRREPAVVGENQTIAGVAGEKGVNGETTLIKLNDRLAHPDERLSDGDVLEFVDIVYSG